MPPVPVKGRTRRPPPPAKVKKPKSAPPKPAQTNAFAPTPTGLAPPKKPGPPKPPKTTLDPATAPFKTSPAEQAALGEIRRRQSVREADIMGRRMQAQSGLPAPGSLPFGGGKPGKVDPYQLDLTAKTELAKANLARRQQGGLLTPAQLKREHDAENVVVNNLNQTTFKERHDLGDLAHPVVLHAPPRARAHAHVDRHLESAPPPERRAQPAYGARGGRPDYVPPAEHGESLLGRISTGLGTGLEAAASVPGTLTSPFNIRYSGGSVGSSTHTPVEDVKPTKLGQAVMDTTGRLNLASEAAASAIGRMGLKTPNVSIPKAELDPETQAAMKPGVNSIPAGALGAAGFTVEASERYRRMAKARGWYGQELANLNGLDLLERAYNDPPNVILRTAQNLGSGLARTGTIGTAVVGLGTEVATGHTRRALGQLAEAGGSFVGNLAHPQEAIVSDPYAYLPVVGAVGKTAGMVGLLRGAEHAGVREVKTGMPAEVTRLRPEDYGPQAPGHTGYVNRGTYSRNLWTQAGERLTDKFAEGLGRNQMFSKEVDRYVRRAANRNGANHQVLQLEYHKAQRAVGKKRAEILLAYQQAGGKPEELAQLYESLASRSEKGELSPEAGAAKFFREKVMPATRELDDNDRRFLDAHALLSEHTSNTLIKLGRFTPAAKLYRQHEGLIIAAAHKADKLMHDLDIDEATLMASDTLPEDAKAALHILHLRKELGYDVPRDAPKGIRWTKRQGKIAEAARTSRVNQADHDKAVEWLDAHPKPVMPKRAHDPEHEAAVAEHKAAAPERRSKGTVQAEPVEGEKPRYYSRRSKTQTDTGHGRQVTAHEIVDRETGKVVAEGQRGGDWLKSKVADMNEKAAKKKKRPMTEEELDAEHAAATKEHGKARPKRAPLTEEEQAALAKYRVDKAEWDKKYAKKHAQMEERVRAFRKAADDANRRGSTLGEAASEEARQVPDKADIFQQYQDALYDFAQHHQGTGGIAPARVAYSKPDNIIQRVRGGGRSLVAKPAGKQAPSTGRTFLSGNYLIDSRSPILDNMHAQRIETAVSAYHNVIDNLAVKANQGDAIPKGMVLIKKSGISHLGRVEHELEANPVAHADHYANEAGIRQEFTRALEGSVSRGTHAAEDGYFVPEGAWKRATDYARPEDQGLYMRALREYQRALISLYPGTTIGNTLGTLPLAFVGGAGRRAMIDARRSHAGLGGDATLAPASLMGRGVAGGLASEAHWVATRYMDFMRRQSVKGEDFGRLAAYWSKAGPHIRKEAERLGMDADEYARSFARGEINPQKLDEFLDHAESFLGDTVKPNGKLGRKLAHVILFQNWVAHMAKLMLYTLPIKHPRRALAMNVLAQYGDRYRREHGIWPSWMTEYLPIFHYSHAVPGGKQHYTLGLNLTQLLPQSTAGGLASNLLGGDRTLQERAGAVLAPPISEILDVLGQQIINTYGTDSNHAVLWKTALNLALGDIPGFRKRYPMQGRKPDDLEVFGMPSYKMYTSNFPGRPLNPYLQPGAEPTRGWGGFGLRAFGFGTYQVPNAGPVSEIQNSKMERMYPAKARQARTSQRSADRKAETYKRMRAAGISDPAAVLGP